MKAKQTLEPAQPVKSAPRFASFMSIHVLLIHFFTGETFLRRFRAVIR